MELALEDNCEFQSLITVLIVVSCVLLKLESILMYLEPFAVPFIVVK